jgi:hypothetical protein
MEVVISKIEVGKTRSIGTRSIGARSIGAGLDPNQATQSEPVVDDNPGEMTQQRGADHHGTESAPQELVQLVGHRDPAALGKRRPRTAGARGR